MVPKTKVLGIALAFFVSILIIVGYLRISEPVAKNSTPRQATTIGIPTQLQITKLNLDAHIEQVGITVNQEMQTPANELNVGWYKLGARPGQLGSAVIAGHYDTSKGGKGIFYYLSELAIGDEVIVVDDIGQKYSFIVTKSQIFEPGYADLVFDPTDQKYLNLITCDGVWNSGKKSYNKRLVVFTVMRN